MKKQIKETWRGWQGHFICSCKFHLNTLLELNDLMIVVSTVGESRDSKGIIQEIGSYRFYETCVFYAKEPDEHGFIDADVTKEITSVGYCYPYNEQFDINNIDTLRFVNFEKEAQEGHYLMLEKIKKQMLSGEIK